MQEGRNIAPVIFICYSHEDKQWADEIQKHLRIVLQWYDVPIYSDQDITSGDRWEDEVVHVIDCAKVALLMVSADALISEPILLVELPLLLEQHKQGLLRIIPIIVKPCAYWQIPWLEGIDVLPKDGKPLEAFAEGYQRNQQMADIAATIIRIIQPDAGRVRVPSRERGGGAMGPPPQPLPRRGPEGGSAPQLLKGVERATPRRPLRERPWLGQGPEDLGQPPYKRSWGNEGGSDLRRRQLRDRQPVSFERDR